MTRPVRLGMLTPSSNTALEPITCAMLAGIDGVSAHFSRFKVTEIALSEHGAAPVRRQRDFARSGVAGACQGRRHRLERHLGELARLRSRRKPVRADHRGDRDQGLHHRAGLSRPAAADRGTGASGW